MRQVKAIWKFHFALIIITLAPWSAAAADLSINDLIGRWCGSESNYTFTPTQLFVVRLDGKNLKNGPVLKIAKVEGNANEIQVMWSPLKPGNSTSFELTADKRQLIQVPETKGDKGPRREFRRC
jgi:hypothetical protein